MTKAGGYDGIIVLFTSVFLKKNVIKKEIAVLEFLYISSFNYRIVNLRNNYNLFINLFRSMYNEFYDKNFGIYSEILHSYLKIILVNISRCIKSDTFELGSSRDIKDFYKLSILVNKNCKEIRKASWYAHKLGLSYKKLNSLCKSVKDKPIKQYINFTVITQIQKELATSDATIKEISYDFSFDESTNFTKYFKKYSNQTPDEFRKSL